MQLLDFTKELIVTHQADGTIFFANKTAQIIFGYSQNEWSNKKVVDLISKNNFYNVADRIFSAGNNTVLEDVILKKQDGNDFHANVRVVHMNEQSGEIALFISDLTYRYEFRNEISKKIKIIESLGKSSKVRKGSIDEALNEILAKSLEALDVSRVNVWISDKDFSSIKCIGSNAIKDDQTYINQSKDIVLQQIQLPKYFKLLQNEDIIVSDDVMNDPQTAELVDSYLAVNEITSMMDVPLRSNGKMIGVICFEHTGPLRKWNVFEIKFGVLIAQIISLLIEGLEKSKLLRKQARLIQEKEELFKETNARVKYIFGLMNAVMKIDEGLCKDDYHRNLFLQLKNNMLRISGIHDIILNSKDQYKVDMEKKILRIFGYLQNLYPEAQGIELDIKVNKVELNISQAMTLGLIIGELIKISYDYSFKNNPTGKISVTLHLTSNGCSFMYKDNGQELTEDQINGGLLALNIIEVFASDINGKFEITTGGGNKFNISFPVFQPTKILEIPVN